MINFLLRFAGLIAFVSGQPPRAASRDIRSVLLRIFQFLTQVLVVGGAAACSTYFMVGVTRHLVDDAAVAQAIEDMIEIAPDNAQLSALESELGGELMMALRKSEGGYGLSVVVGIDVLPDVTADPCDPELAAPEGTVCLFRLRRMFPDQPWLADFVSFEFPGTAYTISHLAIDASMKADPQRQFTQARSGRTRQLIETVIGQNLFLPSSEIVLWGRRVNGPIQAITFALTATGLMLLLLVWLSSVVQNAIVKAKKTVSLETISPSAPTSPPVPAEGEKPLLLGADLAKETPLEPALSPKPEPTEEEQNVVVQMDFPTPWAGDLTNVPGLNLSDAHMTARYYDQVSETIQDKSSILGVVVDPPALRFRRAAARAVANTEDTSILPSFLDAQKDSILAFFDARLSLVRFMLWVIPTVGFVGTILGVSDALSSTVGLQSARDLVAGIAQSSVSASMGMAFDTTLVALIAAVIVMLIFHIVQGAEERMTILERDRAEAEVLELSRSVNKPGTAADLAQQLISLGVNTEHLVRDLRLFQSTGPELRALIDTLQRQSADMEAAVKRTQAQVRRRGAFWRIAAVLAAIVCLAAVLMVGGFFGTGMQAWVGNLFQWPTSWF